MRTMYLVGPPGSSEHLSALFQRGISSRNANFISWCLLKSIDTLGAESRLHPREIGACYAAPLPSPQLSLWV